jgi:hypothetical protein
MDEHLHRLSLRFYDPPWKSQCADDVRALRHGIAGGPKGDGLKTQIEAGNYPGIVKTTLDGVSTYQEAHGNKSGRGRPTTHELRADGF